MKQFPALPFGAARANSLHSRFASVRVVEVLLGPCIAILCLMIAVKWYGKTFERHYAALALMTFLMAFPGVLRLSENRGRMMIKGALTWLSLSLSLSLCLLLFGHATGYLHYFDQNVIRAWQFGTLIMLWLGHELTRHVVLATLQRGSIHKAVIVGANETGLALAERFKDDPYAGVDFLGFFDDREVSRLKPRARDFTMLGLTRALADFVREHKVDHIYLALPMASQPRILALLDALKDTTASIYFAPDIFVTDLIQGRMDHIGGIPVVAVCDTPFTGTNGLLKRLSDIVFATIILIVICPVLLFCALGVKLTSPGPAIFKQKRYGLDGREILVYKFRSMTTMDNGEDVKQATKGDARITPFGAFLRRTSLDELPQFFNVLQGRMSVVGPRPHAVAHNETYRKLIKGYMVRHKVRPGITGWAQVNGARGETDTVEKMERRIHFDLEYLRHWSLGLDTKIILRTVGLIAKDDTAY